MRTVLGLLLSCAPKPERPMAATSEVTLADDPAIAGVTSPVLRQVLADHWHATMARYPEWASILGDHRFDDRLFDPSEEALAAWHRREQQWMLTLSAIPDDLLSAADRTTRDLLLDQLRTSLASRVCRFHEWSVSARDNALVQVNTLAEDAVVRTPDDGRHLVARYRALPAVVDGHAANLRRGLDAGRVGIVESVARVVEMLDAELAGPLDGAPALAPARQEHADWSAAELAAFRTDLRAAFADGVRPALGRYRDLLRDEVMPAARTGADVGLHALPDGEACYRAAVRAETTRDLDPDALHATGVAELERIHAEFRALGAAALGTDDLAQIFGRLRTDPSLHFAAGDEVRAKAEEALRRAEAAVPAWFGRLPKARCTVEPVPDYLAPYTTIAYYQPVRPDGSKPGIYYVNVLAPETRPRHEAEVLAFHESVPGHHLQIALAQELGDLPAVRRYGHVTAFAEGWALYVERLADEMGLYTGPVDRLGMLSFDAWRAGRLVVDTGVHAKGWTREQAEAFLLENTPLAENNIRNEVDRYVTWPGQALAYKVGQLEILRLRAAAEEALGPAFDVKAFHDVVLGAGPVTLPILEERVVAWAERQGR